MYELLVSSIAGVREPQYAPGKSNGLFHKDLHETMSARAEVGVVFLVLDWWLDNRDKSSRAEVLAAMSNFRRFGVERYGRGKPDWTSVQDAEEFLAEFEPVE